MKNIDKYKFKFRTGTVIKDGYGSLWIISNHNSHKNNITNETSYYVEVISLTTSNCSGTINYETITKKENCESCTLFHEIDPECEECNGTGSVIINKKGLDQCKILANNVKEYIEKRLLKNFDF